MNDKGRVLTGLASKPVHPEMSATQKEINKGKGNSPDCTEYDHCRNCCDCQFDHEHDHGPKRRFNVGVNRRSFL